LNKNLKSLSLKKKVIRFPLKTKLFKHFKRIKVYLNILMN